MNENEQKKLINKKIIIEESYRVANVAHNAGKIVDDLEKEFEAETGLNGVDESFLFIAIGLQMVRIVVMNELTKIEKAGVGNRNETALHKFQSNLLSKFNSNSGIREVPYYASSEHIFSRKGVPYDATAPLTKETIEKLISKDKEWGFDLNNYIPTEKLKLFNGGNHRSSTLGHDPIVGLVFGTANIMTNTITCVKKTGFISLPVLTTNHVVYTSDYKDPRIATYGSTSVMLKKTADRIKDEPSVFIGALIKQLIHITTDMYTPYGISIPAANLILDNKNVEKLSSYINTGDILKFGVSSYLADLINTIISAFHSLMYDKNLGISRHVYNVKTRKIIMYSNTIATGSNVLWVTGNMLAGNKRAIKQLDLGGLIVLLKRLKNDKEYIRSIKREFVIGGFKNKIQGEDLHLLN